MTDYNFEELQKLLSIDDYKREKLKLFREFDIELTFEEKEKLRNLSTEIAIDNFCHTIFQKKL